MATQRQGSFSGYSVSGGGGRTSGRRFAGALLFLGYVPPPQMTLQRQGGLTSGGVPSTLAGGGLKPYPGGVSGGGAQLQGGLVPETSGPIAGAGLYPIIQPPTVGNLNPANGSDIYKLTPIEFDVTDTRALGLVEVQADQATREVIHDGDRFLYPYSGSQRWAIPGGFHFLIVRTGGWVTSPVFHVRALDSSFTPEQGP